MSVAPILATAVVVVVVAIAARNMSSKDEETVSAAEASLADTASLEHLIRKGYSFGTVNKPAAVKRVSWDPKEPLLPWLHKLKVPVVFNRTEVDNWPARSKWNIQNLQQNFGDRIPADAALSKR